MDSGVAIYKAVNNGDDFIFVDFNKTGENIDHVQRNELIGKSILEKFPGVKDFGLFDVFQRVWKTGRPAHFPISKYKDERIAGWRDNFVYKLPSGEVVAIYSDETERKQAEEALRESEAKHLAVLEANPDPIVVYDMEGKVIYMNPAFTRVFGWSIEERLGRKLDDFVPADCWPETKMMLNKMLSGERFSGIETRRLTKEGNIIPVRISGSYYRDQEGKLSSTVVNVRDIREEKQKENQLRQSQKMESIGTLAGGIAHEFNNILGIIIGNTELAIDDVPEWNPAKECLKEIRVASMRAKDVVRHILSFARKTPVQRKPIQIST